MAKRQRQIAWALSIVVVFFSVGAGAYVVYDHYFVRLSSALVLVHEPADGSYWEITRTGDSYLLRPKSGCLRGWYLDVDTRVEQESPPGAGETGRHVLLSEKLRPSNLWHVENGPKGGLLGVSSGTLARCTSNCGICDWPERGPTSSLISPRRTSPGRFSGTGVDGWCGPRWRWATVRSGT